MHSLILDTSTDIETAQEAADLAVDLAMAAYKLPITLQVTSASRSNAKAEGKKLKSYLESKDDIIGAVKKVEEILPKPEACVQALARHFDKLSPPHVVQVFVALGLGFQWEALQLAVFIEHPQSDVLLHHLITAQGPAPTTRGEYYAWLSQAMSLRTFVQSLALLAAKQATGYAFLKDWLATPAGFGEAYQSLDVDFQVWGDFCLRLRNSSKICR